MIKTEIIKIVESKLVDMIDKNIVGYLQINVGLNNSAVIHEHFVNKPIKIDTLNKNNSENKKNT